MCPKQFSCTLRCQRERRRILCATRGTVRNRTDPLWRRTTSRIGMFLTCRSSRSSGCRRQVRPCCRAQVGSRSPKAPEGAERSEASGRDRARRHNHAASAARQDIPQTVTRPHARPRGEYEQDGLTRCVGRTRKSGRADVVGAMFRSSHSETGISANERPPIMSRAGPRPGADNDQLKDMTAR